MQKTTEPSIDSKIEVRRKEFRDGVWLFGYIGNTPFKAKLAGKADGKVLSGTNAAYLLAHPGLYRCIGNYSGEDAVFVNGKWISYPKSNEYCADLEELLERLKTLSEDDITDSTNKQ